LIFDLSFWVSSIVPRTIEEDSKIKTQNAKMPSLAFPDLAPTLTSILTQPDAREAPGRFR
jgi:hypothetical protein